MMKLFFLTLILSFPILIFAKDKELPKAATSKDLICYKIQLFAGDNSKVAKEIEKATNENDEGFLGGIMAPMRCENSESICYIISPGISCHKK